MSQILALASSLPGLLSRHIICTNTRIDVETHTLTSAFKYLSPSSSVGIETAFPRTSGKTEVFRTWEKFMGKAKTG